MTRIDPKTLLTGIVAWMRAERVPSTRTRVMKFLYLADLQYARQHGGKTITGWSWYVNAFGPMADEAYALFARGVDEGWLRTSRSGERDEEAAGLGVYYCVAPDVTASDALEVIATVRRWIRELGNNTSKLLRFVYGNTEPMAEAGEGDVLDFSTVHPMATLKPIPSHPFTSAQQSQFKELAQRLRSEYEASRTANARLPEGPCDRAYFDGLPVENAHMGGEVDLIFERHR